jgi:hypothetical protein
VSVGALCRRVTEFGFRLLAAEFALYALLGLTKEHASSRETDN